MSALAALRRESQVRLWGKEQEWEKKNYGRRKKVEDGYEEIGMKKRRCDACLYFHNIRENKHKRN